jgi:hypothetical protein
LEFEQDGNFCAGTRNLIFGLTDGKTIYFGGTT